jgi:hypothetical protein
MHGTAAFIVEYHGSCRMRTSARASALHALRLPGSFKYAGGRCAPVWKHPQAIRPSLWLTLVKSETCSLCVFRLAAVVALREEVRQRTAHSKQEALPCPALPCPALPCTTSADPLIGSSDLQHLAHLIKVLVWRRCRTSPRVPIIPAVCRQPGHVFPRLMSGTSSPDRAFRDC